MPMPMPMLTVYAMYAVIYGEEWEDIIYFTDFDKARARFVIQAIGYIEHPVECSYPIMYAFQDEEGELVHARMFQLDHDKLRALVAERTGEELMEHPEDAYHTIAETDP